MSIFKVLAERIEDGKQETFYLDNLSLKIATEPMEPMPFGVVSEAPGKAGPFHVVKIQLGLNCNYECSYCSQREQPRGTDFTPKDVEPFLEKLATLNLCSEVKFELWGGEPFVYWKTLKPLAERLKEKYPKSQLQVITNGSLLDKEKVDWLDEMNFIMAISHDGPGQTFRGEDPIETKRDIFAYAFRKLAPKRQISISVMLHKGNTSRTAALNFFRERFPEFDEFTLTVSEMGFIDSYTEGGSEALEMSVQDHFILRRDLWSELRWISDTRLHCYGQDRACSEVLHSNFEDAKPRLPSQKCGMFDKGNIAIDVEGNILTCQNVSALQVSHNGKSHKIGNIAELDKASLDTAIHWSQRDQCSKCPVLILCKGSCMFLTGRDFDSSCEASYTDKITQFAVGFEQVTGFVPIKIESDDLPMHRQDIWGTLQDWSKVEAPAKKVIPIKSI